MASKFNIESEHLPVNRSAAFYRKVVNGIQDLVLVLARDGRILFASSACQSLTTFPPEALIGDLVTSFMHHDDLPMFLTEYKNCLAAGESWTFHHRIRRQDGKCGVFESVFKPYHDTEVSKSAGLTGIQLCLMTARPYLTPCTIKMDTFLEQWTIGLRLSSLKRKLEVDLLSSDSEDEDMQNDWPSTFSGSALPTAPSALESTNHPATSVSITASVASPSTHRRTLSGSSGGRPQPESLVGDIGIQITASRLQSVQDTGAWATKPRINKRKSVRFEEYLCRECGTTDSPEWRNGPLGSKSLCNACGLRYSKSRRIGGTSIGKTGSTSSERTGSTSSERTDTTLGERKNSSSSE